MPRETFGNLPLRRFPTNQIRLDCESVVTQMLPNEAPCTRD